MKKFIARTIIVLYVAFIIAIPVPKPPGETIIMIMTAWLTYSIGWWAWNNSF